MSSRHKRLGLATHRGFDQIALDVERSGSTDRVSKQLVEVMGNCLACHATWRLVSDDGR
jgi:cytochrome c556